MMQMVTDIKGSGEKPAIQEAVQHYPNGINLNLTFHRNIKYR